VPSALYSYSFAPNPAWTRAFAGQKEIKAYLNRTAERFGVMPHVRLGVAVESSRWDADAQRWRLTTSDGEYSAQSIIAAAGPWHEPLIPDIEGLSSFPGEVFHSSRWRHDIDLRGKRVAVIGTGASAVQFVPEIAPNVDALHLFQRTAQWVLPKPDHYVPKLERFLLRRVPGARAALRQAEYLSMEALGFGFRHPRVLKQVQKIGLAHLYATVRDPELRRKLTPDYTLGCKRLLMSNSYYRALTRPNVSVHATGLASVQGSTVVGADGTEAEVDVIIFGTGFHILDMPVAERVFDAEGVSLAERWQGSPQAYLGSAVAGYPNMFLLLGPNLGTGHTSAFMIIEAQIEQAVAAVAHLRETGAASIDVRPQIQEAFNARVQAALPTTVYNSGGCSSYYLDENGRNSFSWPWSSGRLRDQVTRFDPADYRVTQPKEASVPA
jgi:cyclohexanone monooxygenase